MGNIVQRIRTHKGVEWLHLLSAVGISFNQNGFGRINVFQWFNNKPQGNILRGVGGNRNRDHEKQAREKRATLPTSGSFSPLSKCFLISGLSFSAFRRSPMDTHATLGNRSLMRLHRVERPLPGPPSNQHHPSIEASHKSTMGSQGVYTHPWWGWWDTEGVPLSVQSPGPWCQHQTRFWQHFLGDFFCCQDDCTAWSQVSEKLVSVQWAGVEQLEGNDDESINRHTSNSGRMMGLRVVGAKNLASKMEATSKKISSVSRSPSICNYSSIEMSWPQQTGQGLTRYWPQPVCQRHRSTWWQAECSLWRRQFWQPRHWCCRPHVPSRGLCWAVSAGGTSPHSPA